MWPSKLYHSVKGVHLLSSCTYIALGKVVRSIEGADAVADIKREESKGLSFSKEGVDLHFGSSMTTRSESLLKPKKNVIRKANRRVSCLTLKKLHIVGAKIKSVDDDDLKNESLIYFCSTWV